MIDELYKEGFDRLCKAISLRDLNTMQKLFDNPYIAYYGTAKRYEHDCQNIMGKDHAYTGLTMRIIEAKVVTDDSSSDVNFYCFLMPPVLKFAAHWGNLELMNRMLKIIQYVDVGIAAANNNER